MAWVPQKVRHIKGACWICVHVEQGIAGKWAFQSHYSFEGLEYISGINCTEYLGCQLLLLPTFHWSIMVPQLPVSYPILLPLTFKVLVRPLYRQSASNCEGEIWRHDLMCSQMMYWPAVNPEVGGVGGGQGVIIPQRTVGSVSLKELRAFYLCPFFLLLLFYQLGNSSLYAQCYLSATEWSVMTINWRDLTFRLLLLPISLLICS